MKLEVNKLTGGYGAELVLDGVEFSVPSGAIVSLVGPNGCGKSTLLKLIGRVLRPRAGDILLDGRSLSAFRGGDCARCLAMLPQHRHEPAGLSVGELVAYGRFPHRHALGLLNDDDRRIVDEVLAMTRLTALRSRHLSTLSGGERQRAWIAMTLAQTPRLLLLDEPTSFLDICCQFEIIELIKELNARGGTTVLMVLHDLNLAAACSDQMIMMKERKVYCAGAPRNVLTVQNLRAVFEIDARVNYDDAGCPYCLAMASARKRDRA